MSEKVYIPFIGNTLFKNPGVSGFFGDHQYFENCMFQKIQNPHSGAESIVIWKRPPVRQAVAPTYGASSATNGHSRIIRWNGAATSTNKLVVGAVVTGTLTAELGIESLAKYTAATSNANYEDPKYLSETFVGTTPAILFGIAHNSTNSCEWFYHTEGSGALTKITDADFPTTNIGDMVYLQGYHFIMAKNGRIYNSDLDSISSWSGDYFSTEVLPDQGCGLARYKNMLVAFNTKSIEFFKIGDSPTGSPLEKILSASIGGGCFQLQETGGGSNILSSQDTVFWIGSNSEQGTVGVYTLNGGSPEKVSDIYLDQALQQAITASTTFQINAGLLCITSFLGHKCLVGYFRANNVTKHFIINLDLKITSYWAFNTISGLSPSEQWYPDGKTILLGGSSSTSYYWTMDPASVSSTIPDNNSIGGDVGYTKIVRTTIVDFGTRAYKRFNRLRMVCDDARATSNVSVSWSDDDGQNFSTARTINLNTFNPFISGLGSSRGRIFKFSQDIDSSNTTCSWKGFELEYDVMNS